MNVLLGVSGDLLADADILGFVLVFLSHEYNIYDVEKWVLLFFVFQIIALLEELKFPLCLEEARVCHQLPWFPYFLFLHSSFQFGKNGPCPTSHLQL